MHNLLQKKIVTNLLIKCFSIIAGCCIWYILSNITVSTTTNTIPLCFYNIPVGYHITHAPEHITVQLHGKKSLLNKIDTSLLSAHVNAHTMHQGAQTIRIHHEQLFLPESIKLVHYDPAPIVIKVEKDNPL